MRAQHKKLFFLAATIGIVVASMFVALGFFVIAPINAHAAGVHAQDTFKRANQNGWGTSSSGQRWEGDANISNAFVIQNNTGVIDAARGNGGTFNALLGGSFADGASTVQGSLSDYNHSGDIGAILRWKDPNNWYKAFIDGQHLIIEKRVAGTFTDIKVVPFTAFPRTQYTLIFTAHGSTLEVDVFAGGSKLSVAKVNDTSLTSGRAGIRVEVFGTTLARFTSFSANAA